MNQEEQIQDAEALAEKLGDAAMAQGDHVLAINALLVAYVAIAKAYPCCTQAGSQALFGASMRLAQAASTGPHHPGQHIH
jgi:hypothetical protein